jgi:Fur family transcriptional regulator, ferric uptake regulator
MRIRGGGKPADDTLPAVIRSGVPDAFIRRCGAIPGSSGRLGAVMESQDLRKAGLKVTHPRMRILELLEQLQPRHMTAEDIYRQLLEHGDEIGLATVYRVLTQFEAAGLVLKHNFEGGHAVYELDRGGHHDHMVDVDTGKVIEFHSDEIEELQRRIAARHGYEIEEHALVLYVRKKR